MVIKKFFSFVMRNVYTLFSNVILTICSDAHINHVCFLMNSSHKCLTRFKKKKRAKEDLISVQNYHVNWKNHRCKCKKIIPSHHFFSCFFVMLKADKAASIQCLLNNAVWSETFVLHFIVLYNGRIVFCIRKL